MPKDLPAEISQNIADPFGGGVWLYLCEIIVPGQTTQRLARNTEDVTYGENTYTKSNFDVSKQTLSGDGSVPRVTLRILHDQNKTLEQIVDDSEGALEGTVKLVKVWNGLSGEAVSSLESEFGILAVESDESGVSFVLGVPNLLSQQVPIRSYSSSGCPYATSSLFKGVECGYSGSDTSCTGTLSDCVGKGNAARWGGDLGLDPNGIGL